MEQFSATVNPRPIKIVGLLFTSLVLISFISTAQNRPFGIVYSENMRGSSATFGNTLMNFTNPDGTVNTVAMNGNSVDGNSLYDNGGFNTTLMRYVDIDGDAGEGAGTINSSSSDLVLPAGTNTVKLARLYWGGRALTTDFNMALPINQRIKVRKGTTGAYQVYQAAQLDRTVMSAGTSAEYSLYQAYVDITDLVQQQGAGTYMVGDGACSEGPGGDFGNYGAWSIVVVYENPALNFNSVRVFDGYQQIYNGGSAVTSSINLSGLNVPSGALTSTDAVLSIVSWEGDARYNGDFFRINGGNFSNAINQVNNPFNGTISSNGTHVTTKNPNYTDQMGIDIDQFNVGTGYGILPNASNVTLQFGTTQDQYFCGVVSFVIRMKDPIIKVVKTVTDASNNQTAEPGEILTYTLSGTNIGVGNANAIVVTDSIPASMTYIPGSLNVISGPGVAAGVKTDAAGDDNAEFIAATNTVRFRMGTNANATTGGFLANAEAFQVSFQVRVNTPASGILPPLVNLVKMVAQSDAAVNYVDEGTVLIDGASGGPLPVTLTSLTAVLQPGNTVKVAWSTSMELNSSSFEVERSTDGVTFTKVATKPAAGNSSSKIDYLILDDVSTVTTPFVYYRLKQIDKDGKSALSKVVSVKLKKTNSVFTVAPNPFTNTVNVNIDWDKNESTVLKVFNVTGAEVLSKTVRMVQGNNSITIDELSQVAPGSYVIQFNTATSKLIRQLVKQK